MWWPNPTNSPANPSQFLLCATFRYLWFWPQDDSTSWESLIFSGQPTENSLFLCHLGPHRTGKLFLGEMVLCNLRAGDKSISVDSPVCYYGSWRNLWTTHPFCFSVATSVLAPTSASTWCWVLFFAVGVLFFEMNIWLEIVWAKFRDKHYI